MKSPEPPSPAKPASTKPVERLFPFVLRARLLLVGAEILARSKSKLHFVLVTNDLSPNSLKKILTTFADYPIVQNYTPQDLEGFFGVTGAKVIGFKKSTLAQSIYSELKPHRINLSASASPKPSPQGPPRNHPT